MVDFIGQVLRFAAERRRAWRGKRRMLLAVAAVAGLSGIGLAALLSNLVPVIVGAGVVVLAGWAVSRVGYAEWSRLVRYARDAWDRLCALLASKEEKLESLKGDPRRFSLEQLMACANEEEIGALERILGRTFTNPEQFAHLLRRKATHEFSYYYKRLRGREKSFSVADYAQMLDLVGTTLGVERNGRSDFDYESALVQAAFSKLMEKMPKDKRNRLEEELQELAGRLTGGGNAGLVLTSSGLVAANLGGFATYTMATSIVGGVASLAGVTLPFAFYTGVSSTLSVLIGPVGWTALTAWYAHRLASPAQKTVFLGTMLMASIRARLLAEVEERREQLQAEIAHYRKQKEEMQRMLLSVEKDQRLDALEGSAIPAVSHDPKG